MMQTAIVILLALAAPSQLLAHIAIWRAVPWACAGEYRLPDHFADANKMVPTIPSQAGATVEPSATKAAPASINWVSLDVARHSGKPIWLHVSGEFCAPCRALEAGPFRDPKLIAASQRWACVAMDAKDTMTFRTGTVPVHEAMGIQTVPRDVFVKRSQFQMVAPSQPCPMDAAGYVRHLDQWWSKSQ